MNSTKNGSDKCQDCGMKHPTDEMFSVDVPAALAAQYERNPFFMCQKCWNHVMGTCHLWLKKVEPTEAVNANPKVGNTL